MIWLQLKTITLINSWIMSNSSQEHPFPAQFLQKILKLGVSLTACVSCLDKLSTNQRHCPPTVAILVDINSFLARFHGTQGSEVTERKSVDTQGLEWRLEPSRPKLFSRPHLVVAQTRVEASGHNHRLLCQTSPCLLCLCVPFYSPTNQNIQWDSKQKPIRRLNPAPESFHSGFSLRRSERFRGWFCSFSPHRLIFFFKEDPKLYLL